MLLLAVFGFAAADLADCVLDLSRLQVAAAAHIALIAASVFAAVGTFTFNVPVRQEALACWAVGQLDLLGVDVAAFHKRQNHLLRASMTCGVVCVAEDVEIDAQSLEDLVEVLVIFGYESFWLDPLGFCIDHDGRSVGIGAADEENVATHLSQGSNVDVRRHISSEMT